MAKLVWSKNAIIADAAKYFYLGEWKRSSPSAYRAAKKNKWVEEASQHMQRPLSHRTVWTKEKILEDALKYKSKGDWWEQSRSAYYAAKRLGIFEDVVGHMVSPEKDRYWTRERITEEAKRFNTRGEWQQKSGSSYQSACQLGILDEASTHMERLQHPSGYWTRERITEDAKKFNTIGEWHQQSQFAYNTARSMGILNQVTEHMKRTGGTSQPEQALFDFVKKTFPKSHSTWFSNKDPQYKVSRFQIDIYIPELRKGIEFDGTYWHSAEGLKRGRPNWSDEDLANYHSTKDLFFKSHGIDVLHIREEEWKESRDNVFWRVEAFLNGEDLHEKTA